MARPAAGVAAVSAPARTVCLMRPPASPVLAEITIAGHPGELRELTGEQAADRACVQCSNAGDGCLAAGGG